MQRAVAGETCASGRWRPAVLLIDPDASPTGILARMLETAGADLSLTPSVSAFLDDYPQRRLDLVLLDVDPADRDVLRDVLSLRAFFGEGPATRIVAIAPFAAPGIETLLLQAGCDGVAPLSDLARVAGAEIARLTGRSGAA